MNARRYRGFVIKESKSAGGGVTRLLIIREYKHGYLVKKLIRHLGNGAISESRALAKARKWIREHPEARKS